MQYIERGGGRLWQIPCLIARGNWKFSWAIRSSKCSAWMGNQNLSRELSVNWNFVINFDILTDVFDILFQNRLNVTPSTSFVGRSRRKGVIRFYKQFFNIIKFWVQSRARLGNWFTVSNCHIGLPLEKNLARPGGGTLLKLHVSHFNTIMVNVSHVLLFIFIFWYVLLGWCQPSIPKIQVFWKTCSRKQSIKQPRTWLTLTIIMLMKWDTCSFRKDLPFDVLHYKWLVDCQGWLML